MLRRNPELQVFAVHDASIDGCSLPLRLRKEPWFPDSSVAIVDLGLRPQHARSLQLPAEQGNPTVVSTELKGLLTAREIAWLEAGNSAELAALPPTRLLRGIYQGLARARRARQGTAPVAAEPERGTLFAPLAGAAALFAFLPWVHANPAAAEEETVRRATQSGSGTGVELSLGG